MTAAWFTDETKARVTGAVRAVEARSAAEIVVSVAPRSDAYAGVDLAAAAAAGLVALVVYVYAPVAFVDDLAPPAVVAAALGAWLLSRAVSPIKRVLVRGRTLDARVTTAAKVAFFDRHVGSTRGRTGVLVYVSLLERRVVVLADRGVEPTAAFSKAKTALEGVLRAGATVDAFVRALEELGPALATQLPRSADDVNELPDEVVS